MVIYHSKISRHLPLWHNYSIELTYVICYTNAREVLCNIWPLRMNIRAPHPQLFLKDSPWIVIVYFPLAAAVVQYDSQTTQGHRWRGEECRRSGRHPGHNRGVQWSVCQRSLGCWFQVGLLRRRLPRKGNTSLSDFRCNINGNSHSILFKYKRCFLHLN